MLVFTVQLSYASSEDLKQYLDNSREFEDLIIKEERNGKLPRVTDKEASVILEKLSRSQSAILLNTYSLGEFGDLLDVCQKANQLGKTYMTRGIQTGVDRTDTSQVMQDKNEERVSNNLMEYQDELNIFYPFLIDCLTVQSSLIEPYWQSLPAEEQTQTRIDGVIQTRTGVLQIYAGVLLIVGDSNTTLSFKDSLLESAAKDAPVMASLLPLDSRKAILNILDENDKTAPRKYQEKYKAISDAFSSEDCNVICQL